MRALRLEHDPIHRHKDVLSHTIAVVDNVRPPDEQPPERAAFDFRVTRLAALFHDVGKPATRGYAPEKGTTFHHHDAVGARMTRARMTALRYSTADVDAVTELVALHLRFHTYRMGWTDSAVRRYVRDAGPYLNELNVLTRCDSTTRNERKARMLSERMDELEARIAQLAELEELASIRPELDGRAVMKHLGLEPGPDVGKALAHLLEIRLEEGLIGEDEAYRRLDEWWQGHVQGSARQGRRLGGAEPIGEELVELLSADLLGDTDEVVDRGVSIAVAVGPGAQRGEERLVAHCEAQGVQCQARRVRRSACRRAERRRDRRGRPGNRWPMHRCAPPRRRIPLERAPV